MSDRIKLTKDEWDTLDKILPYEGDDWDGMNPKTIRKIFQLLEKASFRDYLVEQYWYQEIRDNGTNWYDELKKNSENWKHINSNFKDVDFRRLEYIAVKEVGKDTVVFNVWEQNKQLKQKLTKIKEVNDSHGEGSALNDMIDDILKDDKK